MKKALDAYHPTQKAQLINESIALSLVSIAENLNRLGRQPPPKANLGSE
jgi:hypothetical protein